MKWLVIGSKGQLGQAFQRALPFKKTTCFADRSICDLADPASVTACLELEQPAIIINCAAYTAVDNAEDDEEIAIRINATAVGEIARWASKHGAFFVHFSTDYVFDGKSSNIYTENSAINPLSTYGRSKAAGETLFREARPQGVCIRTSWVHSNDWHNYFLTIKRLMKTRKHLRVVEDQKGVPTTTDFLADVTIRLVDLYHQGKNDIPSIIHAVPDGATSWFGFASHIRDMLAQKDGYDRLADIEPIPSSEFPQAAERPTNSIMANTLLASLIGRSVGKWEDWHNKLYGR